MNKQEALEALLTMMRQWEQPHEETRAEDVDVVWGMAQQAMSNISDSRIDSNLAQVEDLILVGAAALYLLVDEVEIVAGRTLDAWLAEQKVVGYRLPAGVLPGPIGGVS